VKIDDEIILNVILIIKIDIKFIIYYVYIFAFQQLNLKSVWQNCRI